MILKGKPFNISIGLFSRPIEGGLSRNDMKDPPTIADQPLFGIFINSGEIDRHAFLYSIKTDNPMTFPIAARISFIPSP